MAILSHNWLMSWRKKHIFINLSWHGGHGPLLSPFEGLEVPKLYRSSIVWPGLSKTPAPLSTPRVRIIYCSNLFVHKVFHNDKDKYNKYNAGQSSLHVNGIKIMSACLFSWIQWIHVTLKNATNIRLLDNIDTSHSDKQWRWNFDMKTEWKSKMLQLSTLLT